MIHGNLFETSVPGRSVPWRMSNSHALFLCYECMIHDGCEFIAQFIFEWIDEPKNLTAEKNRRNLER